MEIKQFDLEYQHGADYYKIILDLATGNYFQIKNASCTASAESFLEEHYNIKRCEVWKRFKIFDMGTDATLNLDKIYKKYHKYFKSK